VSESLEALVAAELDRLEFDLVELRRGGSKRRPLLDVRIDRRDGGKVSVDDCARASRVIEARLDADGMMGERYVLEVSSPGVERLLRTAADWRRFAGRAASVVSQRLGGRAEVAIVGVEEAADGVIAVVRDATGATVHLPLADVREARLAFHW
jgi:ribosome maturation factor RimP